MRSIVLKRIASPVNLVVRNRGIANRTRESIAKSIVQEGRAISRPWVGGPFSPGTVPPEFVQVYKFWCYYWGLRLLTRLCGPRGGPFELLFPPLSPSASSRSCLSLVTPASRSPRHPPRFLLFLLIIRRRTVRSFSPVLCHTAPVLFVFPRVVFRLLNAP